MIPEHLLARGWAHRGGHFSRSVVVIAAGTAVGQAIGVVTLPIISRLYSPQAFGEYALAVSVSALLTVVVTVGLSSAVMAPEDDRAAEQVVVAAMSCSVVLATFLTAVAVALQRVLPLPGTGMPAWQFCLWVYALTLFNALSALLKVHTNRRGLNKTLAANSVLSALCTLVIAIPLGLLEQGSQGLILASLVAGVLCSLQMLVRANPFRHHPSWGLVTSTLRTYRKYTSYQYAANLMESVGAQLPTQVLAGLYGSSRLGSYSMNERLLGVPLRLLGTPLSTVYFRSISESFRAGRSLAPLTFSIVSKLTLVTWVPMVVLILFGPTLFAWALGEQWREAGVLSAYLVPLYVLTLCRASVSNCRVVIGRQRANTALSATRLAIALLALVVGHAWFGTIAGSVFTLAVGSALFMVLDMTLTFTLLGSHRRRYLLMILVFGCSVLVSWHFAGSLLLLGQ